jgi:type IV pilus assembly protein PilQ
LISGVLQPKPTQTAAATATPVVTEPTTPGGIATEPVTQPVAEASPVPMDEINNEIPATIEPPIGGAASDVVTDDVATPNAGGPEVDLPPLANEGSTVANGGAKPREFQGDELGQVLRLLARQAKIDLVVGETIQGTVTMRLENKTALQAIQIIVQDKGLYMYETDGTFFIKTEAEKKKEPTDAGFYTFSYGRAEASAPLLQAQILSGIPPQIDPRTNTIFYREFKSNMATIAAFLQLVDKPTRQVMIEARLVEVNANPRQAYGVNWGGVFGSTSTPRTISYAGGTPEDPGKASDPNDNKEAGVTTAGGRVVGNDFITTSLNNFSSLYNNQFAVLSLPQMSLTMRLLNEDSDAEFLATPRIVTADNQEATIKIVRSQPVPQLNFNEQTATAVFGGFEEKEYGNKLVVKPSINKDDYISLSVKPEISNKVSDAQFTISGASVFSPIIDTRTLESNVVIKSGNTLAIGGLLQDETTKVRSKVPILGDIPGLGYLFQEKLSSKTKRNLLVFVTPTIIEQGYGTGLEDQVTGLHNVGEEFADPTGWRNNAKGSLRVIPTSNRSSAADVPAPGIAKQPKRVKTKVTTTTYQSNK